MSKDDGACLFNGRRINQKAVRLLRMQIPRHRLAEKIESKQVSRHDRVTKSCAYSFCLGRDADDRAREPRGPDAWPARLW